jgi:hypothetical protein
VIENYHAESQDVDFLGQRPRFFGFGERRDEAFG